MTEKSIPTPTPGCQPTSEKISDDEVVFHGLRFAQFVAKKTLADWTDPPFADTVWAARMDRHGVHWSPGPMPYYLRYRKGDWLVSRTAKLAMHQLYVLPPDWFMTLYEPPRSAPRGTIMS